MKLGSTLDHIKNELKVDQRPKVRATTIKPLEENKETSWYIGFGNDFL